jgi:hypothetical protein
MLIITSNLIWQPAIENACVNGVLQLDFCEKKKWLSIRSLEITQTFGSKDLNEVKPSSLLESVLTSQGIFIIIHSATG